MDRLVVGAMCQLGVGWNDVSARDLKAKPLTITSVFKKYEATFLTTKPLIQGKMLLEQCL